ncbi:hypothetical protein [Kallotenue papyrolyticum]|uniref:hypothetical protein n=1 Tax=Kallotenue papyrolyticum TaxID=1325125 RepID=UPI0004785327|nr:hypothetical protein [Kallotenue papyrolyticum]
MSRELPAVQLALQMLAGTLGCRPEAIEVIDAEAVEWPDSSLGCPQPGMMYMQVITPGYRVVLEHGGQRYTFHTDAGRRAVRCDAGRPPAATR